MVRKRQQYDEDGAAITILDYEGEQQKYDSVVLRFPPNDEVFTCKAYVDDGVEWQAMFALRDLSFDPISAIGFGERTQLTGTRPRNDYDDVDVPGDVAVALQGEGLCPVPQGRWWLDA